ncbi:HBL/NHE enterotoxin family protein [Spirosoma arcticum]
MTTEANPSTATDAPGSAQVDTAMRQVSSSSIVVQTCMQTILNQPDIVLTELPSLPGHQQTARQHADNWFKDINPSIIKITADIVDFGNNWQEYSDPLFALADQLHTDPTAKDQINDGLNDLLNLINQKQQGATAVVNQLDTFRQGLEEDGRNFTADQQTAERDILGDKGTLARMNEDLKTYQSNRSKAIGEIAGGSAMEVVGGLMVVVGVVAEIATAGASTALVVGGLAVAGGGVALTVIGAKALKQSESDIASAMQQISQINESVTALTHVDGQIKDLSAAVATALESVRAMEKGWQVLNADFNELLQDVADTERASWVKVKLQATGKAWAKMLTDATALQTYGRLDVQVSTDVSNRQN